MSDPSIPATDTGLDPNVAGALAYALGLISGILFLVLEKRNDFVRFHAAQAIVVTAAWIALSLALLVVETVLSFIPVVGWIAAVFGALLGIALFFAGVALWLLLMYRAYQGREWALPVLGGYARRLVDARAIPGSPVVLFLVLPLAACGGDGGEPGVLDRVTQAREVVENVGNARGTAEDMRQRLEEMEKEQQEGVTIDPVGFRELKELLPETLPEMQRGHASGEKSGAMGMAISKATAEYHTVDDSDPGVVNVTISDLGGVQPMMRLGFAVWSTVEMDRESDTGFERTTEYEGHPAYIKFERREGEIGQGEMQALVERRFIVEVKGRNVPVERIRGAMERVGLDRLKAMKDQGVTRGGGGA